MTDAFQTTLPAELLQADSLPSMPNVAVQVLRQTQDENATLDDLAQTLSMDPALAAKLLKLSNSSLFNMGSEVTTLQRACMVLGLKTVKLMSLSFSLVSSLHGRHESTVFDLDGYWHRSVVAAVAGRSLARSFGGTLEDEAFLGGLLSRLGQLALAVCLPGEYGSVTAGREGWPTFRREAEVLGFDGRDVVGALLRSWELPTVIVESVEAMYVPDELDDEASAESRRLTSILHVAGLCEELLCGDEPGVAKVRLDEEADRLFGVDSEAVDEFMAGLESSIAEAAEMLNIQLRSFDVADVLAQAQAQLVQISLGVATEMKQVEHKATLLETHNRELQSLAHTDKLTRLANRAAFDEFLGHCVEERLGARIAHGLGLLMVDVDHFKRFNDTHGHQVGDLVLERVGGVLRDVTRDTDLAARYGGEEFSVILPRTTAVGLKALAERIRAAVEATEVEVDGETLSVTVSIGGACIASVSAAGDGYKLVKVADHYLYKAKEGGRNRSELYPRTELPSTGQATR